MSRLSRVPQIFRPFAERSSATSFVGFAARTRFPHVFSGRAYAMASLEGALQSLLGDDWKNKGKEICKIFNKRILNHLKSDAGSILVANRRLLASKFEAQTEENKNDPREMLTLVEREAAAYEILFGEIGAKLEGVTHGGITTKKEYLAFGKVGMKEEYESDGAVGTKREYESDGDVGTKKAREYDTSGEVGLKEEHDTHGEVSTKREYETHSEVGTKECDNHGKIDKKCNVGLGMGGVAVSAQKASAWNPWNPSPEKSKNTWYHLETWFHPDASSSGGEGQAKEAETPTDTPKIKTVPRITEGNLRRQSGKKRERPGNPLGPRYGTRGGRSQNPNVLWHTEKAAALDRNDEPLSQWRWRNPKPKRLADGTWEKYVPR